MLEKLQQRISDRDAALEVSEHSLLVMSQFSLRLGLWATISSVALGVTVSSTCSSWLSLPEEPSETESSGASHSEWWAAEPYYPILSDHPL